MPSPPRRTAAPRPRPTAGDRRSAIDAAGFPRRGPVPPSRLTRGASAHPKESGCSITSPTRTTTRPHHRRRQTPESAPAPRRRRRAATRQAGPPVVSADPEPADTAGVAAPVMSAESTPSTDQASTDQASTDQASTDRSGDAAAAEPAPPAAESETAPPAKKTARKRATKAAAQAPRDTVQARGQEGSRGAGPPDRAGHHRRCGRRPDRGPRADGGRPGRDPYRPHR